MNLVLKSAILDFTNYNHWANETITGWVKSIDVKLIYKEIKSSFPSIDLTLQHLKNAQNFWYAVISNADISSLEEELKINSIDWVITELLKGSQNFFDLVASFSEVDLLTKVSSPAMTKTRYEFILHVINHNSYHRGQIITISRLLGITENIPNTDYDTYLWIRTERSKK
ncbi:MAG: DinB family protein [Bacteroidota bacterium]